MAAGWAGPAGGGALGGGAFTTFFSGSFFFSGFFSSFFASSFFSSFFSGFFSSFFFSSFFGCISRTATGFRFRALKSASSGPCGPKRIHHTVGEKNARKRKMKNQGLPRSGLTNTFCGGGAT